MDTTLSSSKPTEPTKEAKQQTGVVTDNLKQNAEQTAATTQQIAGERLEDVGAVAEQTAAALREQQYGSLSDAVSELSSNVTALADRLQNKNVDELIRDASQFARKNPALFLAGSVAIGFGLTRLVKATEQTAAANTNQAQSSAAPTTTSAYPGTSTQPASNQSKGMPL